jgi:hypothetical protein
MTPARGITIVLDTRNHGEILALSGGSLAIQLEVLHETALSTPRSWLQEEMKG